MPIDSVSRLEEDKIIEEKKEKRRRDQ